MNPYEKPKSKTVDGIKWVTIPQLSDPPRRIEWACSEWGSVRVVKGENDKDWSIYFVHRVEASGYAKPEEAMSHAAALVREVAARRITEAKARGAKAKYIRQLQKREKAVAATS